MARHQITREERSKGHDVQREMRTPEYSEKVRQTIAEQLKQEIALAKAEARYVPLYRGRPSDG